MKKRKKNEFNEVKKKGDQEKGGRDEEKVNGDQETR